LAAIYEDLRKKARSLKRDDGWANVFLQAPFKELRVLATMSASTHVPGIKPFVPAASSQRRVRRRP
ncbi:MAG TPA: hypothetical protein VF215_07720, partial [Thermoanaerobaculia bacterium]